MHGVTFRITFPGRNLFIIMSFYTHAYVLLDLRNRAHCGCAVVGRKARIFDCLEGLYRQIQHVVKSSPSLNIRLPPPGKVIPLLTRALFSLVVQYYVPLNLREYCLGRLCVLGLRRLRVRVGVGDLRFFLKCAPSLFYFDV